MAPLQQQAAGDGAERLEQVLAPPRLEDQAVDLGVVDGVHRSNLHADI